MTDQRPFLANTGYHDTGRELHRPDVPGPAAFIALDYTTSPEWIAAIHSDLVRRAYRLHKTPEGISDAIDLPVSIVRKHLIELGFLEEPRPKPISYKSRSDRPTWSALQRNQHLAVSKEDKRRRQKNA